MYIAKSGKALEFAESVGVGVVVKSINRNGDVVTGDGNNDLLVSSLIRIQTADVETNSLLDMAGQDLVLDHQCWAGWVKMNNAQFGTSAIGQVAQE